MQHTNGYFWQIFPMIQGVPGGGGGRRGREAQACGGDMSTYKYMDNRDDVKVHCPSLSLSKKKKWNTNMWFALIH